jgi:penicillin G amidase
MVTLQRILRALNIAMGVVVLVALAAGYWHLWRPLPKVSGVEQAPVAASVVIERDARGLPHVRASSVADALFAEGYATAQDRMWQMDMSRRLASGELSEVAGPVALALDTRARRTRMRRIAEAQVRELPPEELANLAAYARGVNYYLWENADALPVEFKLMGYEPRSWSVADSLVIALAMNRTLTESWETDIEKWRLEQEGFPERVERLYPIRSGGEVSPGSNAWAISGKWTKSGKAMLANDPHLDFAMPSTWYAVHLRAPGLNVAGVTLPGIPGVLIGHNENIAWGITALQFDTQDLYAETMDMRSGRFLYRGQQLNAEKEADWIAVRGNAPQGVETWRTVHGPVVIGEAGQPLALKWAAAEPGATFPLLAIDMAKNWGEFRQALSRFTGPGLNFLYADANGNIGHQVAGRLPLRLSFAGDVPVDGASGANEWAGFIPFEQLPSSYNPPSGILVNANQNPFPANTAWKVNGRFAPHYRQRQIFERLSARAKWDAPGMLSIQTDIYSPMLKFVAGEAVRAARARRTGAAEKEAAEVLRAWDGRMTPEGPAPLLAALTYQQLRWRIASAAAPKSGAKYADEMAPAVVETLLRECPRDWFADWDLVVANAFSDAIDEGVRLQGKRIGRWSYGRWNHVMLAHPIAGRLGWFARYFNIGPVEMGGHSTTVKQTTRTLGPSMRFVATPGSWDDSVLTLTTGESGQVLSRHYKDQWAAYRDGLGLKLEFSKTAAKSTLTLQPR